MRLRSAISLAFGLASAVLLLGPAQPVARVQGDRVIHLHNTHTKETAEILYKKDGKFLADGLKKASWLLRDWRKNEATEMDPELIDLLWEVHTELGSKEPIHIISGYRSRSTNDMLRRTVGGQASESRHILGKAADVYFPDVPLKRLRYSALIRERGGVGYYPASGSPFVHVDTDRVRAWPRLPRAELALLFPNGKTQHLPADGQPLTAEDVKVARVKQQDLAKEIAEYRASRQDLASAGRMIGRAVVASASPQLQVEPAPALRPMRSTISESDRAGLATLAALAAGPEQALTPPPRNRVAQPMVASLGPSLPTSLLRDRSPAAQEPIVSEASSSPVWTSSPAWDEEHPDELSYRPFAVAPLLGDDPAEPEVLKQLVAPDAIKSLESLDQAEFSPSLALRAGRQPVTYPDRQTFRGPAVAVNAYFGRP